MAVNIAILLLVHKNESQVNRLIRHLAKDFDVYVHIDKRASVNIENIKNVFVYKKYKTYYCSFNLVKATLFILDEAFKNNYDRYILVSGQDLPLQTNEQIKIFFEGNNNEYVHNEKVPTTFWEGRGFERVTEYYPDMVSWGSNNKLLKIYERIGTKFFSIVSKYHKRPIDYNFYGGSQWINITNNCVQKIFQYLNDDKKYIKRYEFTHTSDELFFQTIICNLLGLKIVNDPLRYIDFTIGPPNTRVLREEHYEKLINSKALFARKFEPKVDSNIIELIYKHIMEK